MQAPSRKAINNTKVWKGSGALCLEAACLHGPPVAPRCIGLLAAKLFSKVQQISELTVQQTEAGTAPRL